MINAEWHGAAAIVAASGITARVNAADSGHKPAKICMEELI